VENHLLVMPQIFYLETCNMLEYKDVVLYQTYKYYSKDLKYGYIDKDDWYFKSLDGEYAYLFAKLVLTQISSKFLRLVIKFIFGGL